MRFIVSILHTKLITDWWNTIVVDKFNLNPGFVQMIKFGPAPDFAFQGYLLNGIIPEIYF